MAVAYFFSKCWPRVISFSRIMERPMMVCQTPVRFDHWPVRRAARVGEQVGATW